MPKPKDKREEYRYDFSQEEIDGMRDALVEQYGQYERLEEEKKARTHDLGEQMKRLRRMMSHLNRCIIQGFEMREAEERQEDFAFQEPPVPIAKR